MASAEKAALLAKMRPEDRARAQRISSLVWAGQQCLADGQTDEALLYEAEAERAKEIFARNWRGFPAADPGRGERMALRAQRYRKP
jgi:hypothetical protein